MMNKISLFSASVLLVCSSFSLSVVAQDPPKTQQKKLKVIPQKTSALEVWNQLTKSSLTYESIPLEISPTAGVISYGGEKEGGDALITRIMSPTQEDFLKVVGSLQKAKRRQFLLKFLGGVNREGLNKGLYLVDEVKDLNGNKKLVPFLSEKSLIKKTDSELQALFQKWLSQTEDRPFSFIKESIREKIYEGTFEGMSKKGWIDRAMVIYPRIYDPTRATDPIPIHFDKWKPIFGESEKYISRMVTELIGIWELNFKPQNSFGEFEKMMNWFTTTLANDEGKYGAFGHQWTVLPKYEVNGNTLNSLLKNKLSEVYKASQALIALRGIEMNSGLLTSMYNEIRSDELMRTHNLERSAIRLKDNLFKSNTKAPALNIEQRSGTSYNPTRRMVQQSIVSRYYSNDWSGLYSSKDYVLIPSDPSLITKDLESRFNVSSFEAKRAMDRINSIQFEGDEEIVKGLRANSLAPFWSWENVPYLSKNKKSLVKQVTRNFIQQLAAIPDTYNRINEEKVLKTFAIWSAVTDLDTDIENYLKPKNLKPVSEDFAKLKTSTNGKVVDVNQLDFGIEYTAKFPIRADSKFTEEELKLGKKGFLQLEYDLTPEEKRNIIKTISEKFSTKIHGKAVEVKRVDSPGHGHKIAITYEVPGLKEGDTWRLEWDGISREYTLDGEVIMGSERGGVIEVVTPKYVPSSKEVEALFQVFEEEGMKPSFQSGGGHVNFDLNTFKGKPKQFAKFLALFLENRDIITAMFQHPGRFTTAEPHQVSSELIAKLSDFNGTEDELKKLLYNEQFFNTRLGRKSKYVQLEISSYFQDVIPEEFITKDFDIKNDVWRRQFRVNPNIRKGEFRLLGAPRSVHEASAQIKLVRALINEAINDDRAVQGKVAEINLTQMVENAKETFARFESVMKRLNLDPKEFETYFADGLQNVRYYVDSSFYVPYDLKMAKFPQMAGWKKAVNPRPIENAIDSKGRVFGEAFDAEALKLAQNKQTVKRQTSLRRESTAFTQEGALQQVWRKYDEATVARVKSFSWAKMMNYPEIAIDYLFEKTSTGIAGFEGSLIELDNSQMIELIEKYKLQGTSLDEVLAEKAIQSAGKPTMQISLLGFISDPSILANAYIKTFFEGGQKKYNESFLFVQKVLRQKDPKFQARFLSDINLRRGLYSIPGRISLTPFGDRQLTQEFFETHWGDLIHEITGRIKKVDDAKIFVKYFYSLFTTEEVALGNNERKLMLALYDQSGKISDYWLDNIEKIKLRRLRFEEEEEFSSVLRRRCREFATRVQ